MIEEQQFDERQQAAAVQLLESLPWGDVDSAILAVGQALVRALDASRDMFLLWERHLPGAGGATSY